MAMEISEVPQTQPLSVPINYSRLDTLPSKRKLYPELFLRKLTVFEVKMLANSLGSVQDISRILAGTILPVPFQELAVGDLRFIMAILKTMTFKGAYWTVSNLRCPHCSFMNSKLVTDRDLKFHELADEVQFPATYTHDEVQITVHDVFRVKHQVLLESLYSSGKMTELKDNTLDIIAVLMIPPADYNVLVTMGKLEAKVLENYEYLTSQSGEVAEDLDKFVDYFYFDVDKHLKHTCKSCGKDFDFELNIGSVEHFFPQGESRESIREKVRFGVQET